MDFLRNSYDFLRKSSKISSGITPLQSVAVDWDISLGISSEFSKRTLLENLTRITSKNLPWIPSENSENQRIFLGILLETVLVSKWLL